MDENHAEPKLEEEKTKPKREKRAWKKVVWITILILLIITGVMIWYSNYLLDKINYEDGNEGTGQEYFDQDENADNLKEMNPDDVVWEERVLARHEDNVINVLLVGEEAINDGGNRGRTDSIMIATIDVKAKALKLTSIMRDLYVQIPGYSDNKINAAYHIGGMQLLVDTVNQNFDLKLDGYVKVDFDSFEGIIDALGGVEITLSQKEANYLNSTNYISNPKYRNVVAGTQTLNGNQALGYSRIRYVATDTEANDFGRTLRQRKVLTALFEKYKSKSVVEILSLLPDVLGLITTDLSKMTIVEYLYLAITLQPDELQTFRIPVEGAFYGARIRGMAVLVPDTLSENVEALHGFLFGSSETDVEVGTVESSGGEG